MAIVSIHEAFHRRRSSRDGSGRKHTRVFRVRCDDPADGTAVALGAAGIPAYGAAHPNADGTTVQSITAEPVNRDDLNHDVIVEYAVAWPGAPEQNENPLLRPPSITVEGSETAENYFRDIDDTPVVNSAGEPFEQLPTRDGSVLTITLVRNEASRDIAVDDSYTNTLNDGSVTIDGTSFAGGMLKMSPIRSELVIEGSHTYYRKTYRIKARALGWTDRFEDRGFHHLVSGTATRITMPDEMGNLVPIQKTWPLDGEGGMKPAFKDKPEVLEFFPYVEKSWSPLGFS